MFSDILHWWPSLVDYDLKSRRNWQQKHVTQKTLLTVLGSTGKTVSTYLCGVRTTENTASPHHIFDTLHFLLVAMPILHGSFLRLLQRTLQGLDPFSCRPETFLQFGKLTSQVCIVTHQLSNTRVHVNDSMISNFVIHAICFGLNRIWIHILEFWIRSSIGGSECVHCRKWLAKRTKKKKITRQFRKQFYKKQSKNTTLTRFVTL